jgi:hypothetical protein
MGSYREVSALEWQTLFAGEWQEGWMHLGIAQLQDGRLVFEAPGGKALIFLDTETGIHERVTVG